MICPNCQKPYFFMAKNDSSRLACLNCRHERPFSAPVYDKYHENLYSDKPYKRTYQSDPQMKDILDAIGIRPEDEVLDIGCGVGDYTKAISEKFSKNITGIDIDTKEAKRKYPGLKFLDHDANTPFPFPDETFDKIVSINCIEHLKDFEKFLSECRRVLKNGGLAAITTANLDFFLHNYFFDPTHIHEWTLTEFKNIVGNYFSVRIAKKSSSMFKYYPFNFITTKFLKPDITVIATKEMTK